MLFLYDNVNLGSIVRVLIVCSLCKKKNDTSHVYDKMYMWITSLLIMMMMIEAPVIFNALCCFFLW